MDRGEVLNEADASLKVGWRRNELVCRDTNGRRMVLVKSNQLADLKLAGKLRVKNKTSKSGGSPQFPSIPARREANWRQIPEVS
jgi:hypothetical protein